MVKSLRWQPWRANQLRTQKPKPRMFCLRAKRTASQPPLRLHCILLTFPLVASAPQPHQHVEPCSRRPYGCLSSGSHQPTAPTTTVGKRAPFQHETPPQVHANQPGHQFRPSAGGTCYCNRLQSPTAIRMTVYGVFRLGSLSASASFTPSSSRYPSPDLCAAAIMTARCRLGSSPAYPFD